MERTNNERTLFPFGKPQVKDKDPTSRSWDGIIFLWLAILTASVIYFRPEGELQSSSQAIAALESEISEIRESALYAEDGVVELQESKSDLESRIDDLESEIEDVKSDLNLL
ncbi:hypothetical protein [Peredibacter starrii]|uniref:Uncharacterized protein n=1 Tax=Peredibacter starrii TaxID=28202 RepID=A0AAX4HUE3_9BACT|nr:hypothetical protein [Peredibacter starrii]WPU66601.1 hypothetical protein SOO65_07570 [Peredibacter starrii]